MSTVSARSSDRSLTGFYRRIRRRGPLGRRAFNRSRESDNTCIWPSSSSTEFPAPALEEAEMFSRIRERCGANVEAFYRYHLKDRDESTVLISSLYHDQVQELPGDHRALGVLTKVNNCRRINKYFRAANSRLKKGGTFIGCAEVNGQRRTRMFAKYPSILAAPICFLDFIFHRMGPKLPYLNKVYFAITKGRNRPVARSEALGRLVSCGFAIIDYRDIDGLMYFAVRKVQEADVVLRPTYGPFCALRRIGIGGERFTVYKFRTMHPYAEFLQDYLFQVNKLKDGGKFNDDFRITAWGSWMRRLWLDELPMIVNVLKGEMKLVGVRPLSNQYFNLYPEELRDMRTRHLPGLVPPFYVDMPKTLDDIVESEMRYLKEYEQSPFLTDLKYFLVAIWNIVVKRARSA